MQVTSVDGLSSDIGRLYVSGTSQYGDVLLIVDGTRFTLHKCILSVRSPRFFPRVFETYANERSPLRLFASARLSAPVFDHVCKFMYSGCSGPLSLSIVVDFVRMCKCLGLNVYSSVMANLMIPKPSDPLHTTFSNTCLAMHVAYEYELRSEFVQTVRAWCDLVNRDASVLTHPDSALSVLPRDLISFLLQLPCLHVDEIYLFHALIMWGKKEVQRRTLDQTPEAMGLSLGAQLQLIQFECMTTEQLVTEVESTQIVPSSLLLQAYRAIALTGSAGRVASKRTESVAACLESPMFRARLDALFETHKDLDLQVMPWKKDVAGLPQSPSSVNRQEEQADTVPEESHLQETTKPSAENGAANAQPHAIVASPRNITSPSAIRRPSTANDMPAKRSVLFDSAVDGVSNLSVTAHSSPAPQPSTPTASASTPSGMQLDLKSPSFKRPISAIPGNRRRTVQTPGSASNSPAAPGKQT
jgi:hypothetical protein